MGELLSQSKYAKRRGCSQQFISKLIKQGRLTAVVNGRIDAEATDRELDKNLISRSKVPKPKNDIKIIPKAHRKPGKKIDRFEGVSEAEKLSFFEAMRLKTECQARLAELELEKVRKSLGPREEFEQFLFTLGRFFRDTVQNIPSRICPGLPCDEKTKFNVEFALKNEFHQLLEELSRKILEEKL